MNIGQEFGTYGQYNRVLRIVDEMEEIEVAGSRLKRELKWNHLHYLNEFAVTVKDSEGRKIEIIFLKDSPEMVEYDSIKLKNIIRDKVKSSTSQ